MSKTDTNTMDEVLERLKNIEDMLTVLTAGRTPRKRSYAEIAEIPLTRREVLRDAELKRIFTRLWEMTTAQKDKANFPQFIVQLYGNHARIEAVPQSILVNRCELLKAFWPGKDEDSTTPRSVTLETLERAVAKGELVRCTMADYTPATRNDRSGETVLILTPAEAKRRHLLPDDEDEEEVVEAEAAPSKLVWPEQRETPAPAPAAKKSWSIGEEDDE